MKKRILMVLVLCLLLTGCGTGGKKYVSVTPHLEQRQNAQSEAAVAENSLDLIHVLEDMIRSGMATGIIYIPEYPLEHVGNGMDVAIGYCMNTYSLGAYVVEDISYEVGATGGLPAMAVNIRYRHTDAEIRQIREIAQMNQVQPLVAAALEDYDSRLVIRTDIYFETDFQQMVRDYAEANPEKVMEIPQTTVSIFGSGMDRVVELTFTYQNGRDALRLMQSQVKPVFEAAELYVSGDAAARQKYAQLYAFLMERFDYMVETSITPAYSLLHHGVGDSRAFATVYAAICRRAGLECLVVTGTRTGEPWVWNIIQIGDSYQHLDLLNCSTLGRFQTCGDREMEGYVWDYSAYPQCFVPRAPEPSGETSVLPQQETMLPEQETEPSELPEVPEESPVPEETGTEKPQQENFEEK